ncbi:MAG TPA: hypothetical protein EYH27_04135 [Anaerolineales bacterium]|nr:hypothetical protein [Anaerolineae bacterium]HIP87610.1 hypothetical protein [Anaerolineales bacterium]
MAQARSIDLDILPERYRPRRLTAVMALFIILAMALVMGLAPAISALRVERARTLSVQARLAQVETALAQVQVNKSSLEEMEQQIAQVQAEIDQLQAEYQALSRWQADRSSGITSAVFSLLPGVRLTGITQEDRFLTIRGEAGSQALVLDYARALQASGEFRNVRILSMVDTDPLGMAPDVRFSILAEQKP